MEPQAAPHGGWVARVVEVDGVVQVVSGRKVRKLAVGPHAPGLLYLFWWSWRSS